MKHKKAYPSGAFLADVSQDNNQRFNDLLNTCENPRRVYNALMRLAESGVLQELRKEWADERR